MYATLFITLVLHKSYSMTYRGQYPPFRGLNGGYRGLMGIAIFHIFLVKVMLSDHQEPLEMVKQREKILKSKKKRFNTLVSNHFY